MIDRKIILVALPLLLTPLGIFLILDLMALEFWISLAFSAGSAFALLGFLLLLHRRMIRNSRVVLNFIHVLSTGSGDLRGKLPPKVKPDDKDIWLKSYLKLVDQLNRDFVAIKDSASKFSMFSMDIASSSSELSHTSQMQAQGMNEVRDMVSGFRQDLKGIQGMIAELFLKIKETSADMDAFLSANNSGRATLERLQELSQESRKEMDSGKTILVESAKTSQKLIKGMGDLSRDISSLENNTKEIKQVADLIQDIAQQTHILATNASIEAARAGQEGRGFGIVAKEIRRLSSQTANAVSQVESSLKEINLNTKQSLSSFQALEKDLLELGQQTQTSQSAIDKLSGRLGNMFTTLREMSANMGEQNEMIGELGSATNELLSQGESVSSTIEKQMGGYNQINSIVSDQTIKINEYAESSKILSELANYLKVGVEELTSFVRRFKLDEERARNHGARESGRSKLVYNLEIQDSNNNRLGYLGDISEGGLLLMATQSVPDGTIMDLRILPPLSQQTRRPPVEVQAEVRWVKQVDRENFHYGMKFTRTNDELLKFVHQLTEELTIEVFDISQTQQELAQLFSNPQSDDGKDAEELEEL